MRASLLTVVIMDENADGTTLSHGCLRARRSRLFEPHECELEGVDVILDSRQLGEPTQ